MKTYEGTAPSFDGTPLFYRLFSADNPKLSLLVLHGHGEHSGRYVKLAESLQDLPVQIAIMDLRGMGQSGGECVYIESFEDFLNDVSSFVTFLQKHYNFANPFVILGHSLGGLIAVHWCQRHEEKVKALILSSPFLGLPLKVTGLARALNAFFPGWILKNPVIPKHLTHNLEEVKRYKADNLIARKISIRLLYEILAQQKKLQEWGNYNVPFPVFILMAGDERIVDPKVTKAFYQKIQAPQKELIEFPDFYHEIFNESEQQKAFDALRKILRLFV